MFSGGAFEPSGNLTTNRPKIQHTVFLNQTGPKYILFFNTKETEDSLM